MASPRPVPPTKLDCRGSNIFARCLGIEAHSRVAEADAHPEGRGFQRHRQNSAVRHGAQRVVGQIPEHLLDAVAVDANADSVRRKRPLDAILSIHLRVALQQRQRFVQQLGDVFFRKFVGFFARIIQKLGDDFVQALRFPADDADQVLFVLLAAAPGGPIP